MCKINCSGGCPDCAPDEHYDFCIERFDAVGFCICELGDEEILEFPDEPG